MKTTSFNKQILSVFFMSIGFTILFSFFFIHYLYSDLYISSIEESIVYQGQRTASHYHYGELNDEIINKIHWYNIVSEFEIIVVDDLENLNTYFPYQINYETLVDEEDRVLLEQGTYIMKEGYVEELNHEIIGAIFPIKSEYGLIGFIYIYVPLATIQDVFSHSIPVLLCVGALYFIILFFIVNRAWKSIFRPLKNLEQLAVDVSKGNYSKQLPIERHDEIGRLTKAFNQMSLSLQQQEERKKEFISNIVHELRTPLTYIRGYSDALKQKIYTSPKEAEDYLTTIDRETERLNKLINDLIDLNHLQEDLYMIDKQPIPIAQLLFDTLDLFAIHLSEKSLKVDLQVDEDVIISGDARRIQQVFYNTIDNAIKYSSPSSTVTISLQNVAQVARYNIHNEGITIKEADLARIGERFFRTDKARNRSTGGTGLGLSIVKEIVRLHEGEFTITSDDAIGTTVTIKWPLLNIEGDDT